jgi:hypothetical protein
MVLVLPLDPHKFDVVLVIFNVLFGVLFDWVLVDWRELLVLGFDSVVGGHWSIESILLVSEDSECEGMQNSSETASGLFFLQHHQTLLLRLLRLLGLLAFLLFLILIFLVLLGLLGLTRFLGESDIGVGDLSNSLLVEFQLFEHTLLNALVLLDLGSRFGLQFLHQTAVNFSSAVGSSLLYLLNLQGLLPQLIQLFRFLLGGLN